jgi:RimJ/RimL family protein N-acetyltransferase
MLKFREMTADDFPLMLRWLTMPHVREWWDDGDDTLEKIARHYGAREEGLGRFILVEEKDGAEREIGYFQYYDAGNAAVGIDQFIGEQDYLNRGVGTAAVKLFIEMLREKERPQKIILDPHPANRRAIRCYEKAGFRHYETVKHENGEDAFMMSCEIRGER